MKTNLAHEGVGMESSGGRRVEERDEGARLLGKDTNVLDRTETNLREELVDRSVGRKVSYVNGATLERIKVGSDELSLRA